MKYLKGRDITLWLALMIQKTFWCIGRRIESFELRNCTLLKRVGYGRVCELDIICPLDHRSLIVGLRVVLCHMPISTIHLRIRSFLSGIFLVILLLKVLIKPEDGMGLPSSYQALVLDSVFHFRHERVFLVHGLSL
jgi:hypothetical protein